MFLLLLSEMSTQLEERLGRVLEQHTQDWLGMLFAMFHACGNMLSNWKVSAVVSCHQVELTIH